MGKKPKPASQREPQNSAPATTPIVNRETNSPIPNAPSPLSFSFKNQGSNNGSQIEEQAPTVSGNTEVFRNDSGRLSGLTLPDGRTFLGLSPDEAQKIIDHQNKVQQTPSGAVEVGAQRQAEQNQQLLSNVGNTDSFGLEGQASGIDTKQALLAGAAGIAPTTLAGGATALGGAVAGGALAGTAVLPGVGTLVGAAIGAAIAGFTSKAIGNMKSQKAGEITAAGADLRTRQKNLKALITDTNRNPANAADNLQLFNYQLALINQDYSKLVLETNSNTNKFLGEDGTTQLSQYSAFNERGGQREFLIQQMQVALLAPDSNKNLITADDLVEGND